MMQQTFGSHNCFLLTINSRNSAETDREPVTTDLWTPYIKRSDTINVSLLIAKVKLLLIKSLRVLTCCMIKN